MKKQTSHSEMPRARYALLLLAVAALVWLLAQPRPGLRVATLQPVLAPEPPAANMSIPERIRVATYNLEHFTDGRGDEPERTPAVLIAHARGAAAIISEANPDILLLQEVENPRALEFLNDQLEFPYPWVYITCLRQSSGAREKLNLALLSRLGPVEVRQLGFYNLAGLGRPTRGALAATFLLGDSLQLLVYNIHLKSNFGEAPRNQAQRGIALHQIAADVLEQIYRGSLTNLTGTTLILGDTNVDPEVEAFAEDPSLEPLAGAFVDLWRGRPLEERITIPTRQAGETGDPLLVFPPAAFDRVFASKNLVNGRLPWQVQPPQTIPKGSDTNNNLTPPGVGGHISDHYLVYVDLIRIAPAPAYSGE